MGGPNLLRSPVALADKHGESIVPIIHGSRAKNGMPPIGISDADAEAVAAYVRSVVGMIGVQGMPPSQQEVPRESVLVGNAAEGKPSLMLNVRVAIVPPVTCKALVRVLLTPECSRRPGSREKSAKAGAIRPQRQNPK